MSNTNYKPQREEVKSEAEKGKAGYVRDFITNTWIKATPEEIEAVIQEIKVGSGFRKTSPRVFKRVIVKHLTDEQ